MILIKYSVCILNLKSIFYITCRSWWNCDKGRECSALRYLRSNIVKNSRKISWRLQCMGSTNISNYDNLELKRRLNTPSIWERSINCYFIGPCYRRSPRKLPVWCLSYKWLTWIWTIIPCNCRACSRRAVTTDKIR